ncbi:hypothetical protein FQN49_004582 [Arthroderma sp. PD_2]|nr:hypothetical protein FQN49_004582 [Arthroderma sp. PD_2]
MLSRCLVYISLIVSLVQGELLGREEKSYPQSSPGSPELDPAIAHRCTLYHQVRQGENCLGIALQYEIAPQDLARWNKLGTRCSRLRPGRLICVGVDDASTQHVPRALPTGIHFPENPPMPSQPGVSKTCVRWYKAERGDNCKTIAEERFDSFTLEQFMDWNPAVGPECTRLYAGWYYCIGVSDGQAPTVTTTVTMPTTGVRETWPAPTGTPNPPPIDPGPRPQQPGTIRGCRLFHHVRENDNCFKIEEIYGISDTDFQKWNPEVGVSCLNLWAGYYVCVRG